MRVKTYSMLVFFHNSHITQFLKHFGSPYGLLVSVLHRQTQFLLNKTKGFNTSLFASMNAFVWFAVHSTQLVLFLKCIRRVLKATQMTRPAFKRSTCHRKHCELSRQRKSIKPQNCGRISSRV